MYLGIEIGGTKLQLGVGDGQGPELATLVQRDIDAGRGAAGILEQIEESALDLLQRYDVSRIGIGFGGPVDSAAGRAIISHQVEGWENSALTQRCRDLVRRAGGVIQDLTGKLVGQAAAEGNRIAADALEQACRVRGWAIAQTITLLAPEVVVIGGGVSLLGEKQGKRSVCRNFNRVAA